MKLLILFSAFLAVFTDSYGQSISNLKTDEACLRFIQQIPSMKDFYFDTLFSAAEKSKLNPAFKSWQKADLNGDKKPDLIFAGAFHHKFVQPNTAMIYISDGDSYKLIPIVREGRTSFRPHVFTRKYKDQLLIIVQNYHDSEFEKVETFLREGGLSRETCPGDDTLIFNHGFIVDYAAHSSNLKFDSLILVKKYGWSCAIDSFIIDNSENGKYYTRCRVLNKPVINFQLTKEKLNWLKNLIAGINLKKIPGKSFYGGTDNNSVTLLIYHGDKVETFYDYGLETSFTFKALYHFFDNIRKELE